MGNKTGLASFAKGRVDVHRLDPRDIRVKEGFNVRDLTTPENLAHVEDLAASIAEHGVKVPLRVYLEGESIFLSDGHCRLAATMLAIERGAEIATVPAMAEDRYSSDADKTLVQITANSGKRLSPLETARVFKRLLDYGWDEATIAAKAGVTKTRVTQLLELQAAPADVQAMVAQGEVSASLAMATPVEKLRETVEKARVEGKARVTKKDTGMSTARKLALVTELLEMVLADENAIDTARNRYETFKEGLV